MKQLSTGTGLAILAASIVIAARGLTGQGTATTAHAATTVPTGMVASALGQTSPTIVWYGVSSAYYPDANYNKWLLNTVTRAWSDGRVEMKVMRKHLEQYQQQDRFCNGDTNCDTGWRVISSPSLGYSAFADLDFNEQVDTADLAMVLLNFGDAPRQDMPPSDCPLNLVNP